MTASKLALLQKLLIDREQLIIFHQNSIFCSCGKQFEDINDIENHLVQNHEKFNENYSSRKKIQDLFQDFIEKIAEQELSYQTELEQFHVKLPPKTIAICLEEEAINGGQVCDILCPECSASCWSFKTLKDHYLRQHPGLWPCKETCLNNQRILFEKPSKERLPKGWSYMFYCPLPGCKYHISQHGRTQQGSLKAFQSYTLLKQHFLKIHASKNKVCDQCNAAFATEVFLLRHRKTSCGRSFSCLNCKALFGSIESLQTHCRRKGHCLPPEFGAIKTNLKRKLLDVDQDQEKTEQEDAKNELFPDDDNASTIHNNDNKYIKIAPKPSIHAMTAAIALSELSSITSTSNTIKSEIDCRKSLSVQTTDVALWAASSTQTSPRVNPITDTGTVTDNESLIRTNKAIPKLGEIEQFSTETQTDEMEILPRLANDDTFNMIEAQTQFDLDDILCSNYTQTALFDASLDHNSIGVNTIETQTMFMPDELVNMETQTMSMLFEDQ